MKKVLSGFILAVILIMGFAAIASAEPARMNLKPGDTVYACNCGPDCRCDNMSKKPGTCVCGDQMVQAKVTKVEGDVAYLEAPGWQQPRPFKMTGKYACDCGPGCDCGTISQKPGKCVCGKEMKKVE